MQLSRARTGLCSVARTAKMGSRGHWEAELIPEAHRVYRCAYKRGLFLGSRLETGHCKTPVQPRGKVMADVAKSQPASLDSKASQD